MTDFGDSPYAVLEVARGADAAAIEAAYRRLGGLLAEGSLASYGMLDHADVGQLRHQLEQAYSLLSDPARRAAFDRTGDTTWPPPASQARDSGTPTLAARGQAKKAASATKGPRRAPGSDESKHKGSHPAATPGAAPASFPSAPAQLDAQDATPAAPTGSVATSGEAAPRAVPRHRPNVPGRPTLQVPLLAELGEDACYDGAQLRALRESARVSLEELSEWTKIGRRYLLAIEDDDFALLPAKVYVRGFVGEVARILGLDAPAVTRSYLARFNAWAARN